MRGFSLRGVKPVSVRRNQNPRIAQPLVRLVSIVELPPKPTIPAEREGVEGHILEQGGEAGLEGNPEGAVRAYGDADDGNVELRSNAVIEEKAIGVIDAPCCEYRCDQHK